MITKQKVLTVSVAAYNCAEYIDKCVDSMLIDSVKDEIEIIIVNDGSKDDTLKIAKKYQDQFPEIIKVVDKENGGHGSTINSSLKAATGKYFKVVDSDDWVEAEGFERLVIGLRDLDADLVISPFFIVDNASNVKTIQGVITNNKDIEPYKVYSVEKLPSWYDVVMHAVTYRTEILNRCGRKIDEHCFYVDKEYVLYPISLVNSIAYFDSPVYNYLFGTAEQSCNRENMIRRNGEHLQVCNSMLTCFGESKYTPSQEIIAKSIISGVCRTQLFLYLSIGDVDSKNKLKKFDSGIKSNTPLIYSYMLKSACVKDYIVISVLRISRYSLFGFLSRVKSLKKLVTQKRNN